MYHEYPERINWIKSIHPDIFPDFGKNASKKIKTILASDEHESLSCEFQLLTEDFFIWFLPLYNDLVATRKNFIQQDIVTETLENAKSKYPYYCFTLSEAGLPIGGAIFTLREDRLSLVYRAIQPVFSTFNSRCSPALYSEYQLTKYALDNKLHKLVHGSDPNLYGMNLAIGIAIFKLSVGCKPTLSKTPVKESIMQSDIETNTLLLSFPPTESNHVNEAFLVTTENDLKKYEQLLKYEHLLKIKTIIR